MYWKKGGKLQKHSQGKLSNSVQFPLNPAVATVVWRVGDTLPVFPVPLLSAPSVGKLRDQGVGSTLSSLQTSPREVKVTTQGQGHGVGGGDADLDGPKTPASRLSRHRGPPSVVAALRF